MTRPAWSRAKVVSLLLLVLFCGAYSAVILAWEEFTSYDESQLTGFSVRGIDLQPMVQPEGGRFYPLSMQEFNLIRHVTTTPAGYHAFAVAELLALILILLALDESIGIAGRVALILCALLVPSIAVSFAGLVYAERNVLLLLACLAVSVKRFDRRPSAWWAAAAVLCSQLMLYIKEPVFLLLFGFAAARLILRCRISQPRGWDWRNLRTRQSRLDIFLTALSLAFLGVYVFMMFPHRDMGYLAAQHKTLLRTVGFYASHDLMIWIFAVVTVARLYTILRRGEAPWLLWDGLAAGALAYFAAYLVMGMTSNYYLAPADLIAALYLGRMLFLAWGSMRLIARVPVAALATLVVGLNLGLTSLRLCERKYFVRGKAEIARLIGDRYRHNPKLVQGIYFPFSDPWVLAEYLAYLEFRGLPAPDRGQIAAGRLQIFSGKILRDGDCWIYSSFTCHTGAAVEAGSLVVILPDDPVWPAQTESAVRAAEPVFSYFLNANVPAPVRWWFNRMPRQWMQRPIDELPPVFLGIQR